MQVTNDYVFFWNGEFSNWYKCNFEYKGIKFNCSEQAMMWEKANVFKDEDIKHQILATDDPKTQKVLGRQVKSFDKDVWESVCIPIITDVLYSKFTQNPKLLEEILSYGDREFVEASPYDKVWGIGMAENTEGIEDPKNWKGKNFLGICLTNVRNKILKEIENNA